ncbi:hypothetical protein ACO0QE_002325 [Hanseniaspora vineae]
MSESNNRLHFVTNGSKNTLMKRYASPFDRRSKGKRNSTFIQKPQYRVSKSRTIQNSRSSLISLKNKDEQKVLNAEYLPNENTQPLHNTVAWVESLIRRGKQALHNVINLENEFVDSVNTLQLKELAHKKLLENSLQELSENYEIDAIDNRSLKPHVERTENGLVRDAEFEVSQSDENLFGSNDDEHMNTNLKTMFVGNEYDDEQDDEDEEEAEQDAKEKAEEEAEEEAEEDKEEKNDGDEVIIIDSSEEEDNSELLNPSARNDVEVKAAHTQSRSESFMTDSEFEVSANDIPEPYLSFEEESGEYSEQSSDENNDFDHEVNELPQVSNNLQFQETGRASVAGKRRRDEEEEEEEEEEEDEEEDEEEEDEDGDELMKYSSFNQDTMERTKLCGSDPFGGKKETDQITSTNNFLAQHNYEPMFTDTPTQKTTSDNTHLSTAKQQTDHDEYGISHPSSLTQHTSDLLDQFGKSESKSQHAATSDTQFVYEISDSDESRSASRLSENVTKQPVDDSNLADLATSALLSMKIPVYGTYDSIIPENEDTKQQHSMNSPPYANTFNEEHEFSIKTQTHFEQPHAIGASDGNLDATETYENEPFESVNGEISKVHSPKTSLEKPVLFSNTNTEVQATDTTTGIPQSYEGDRENTVSVNKASDSQYMTLQGALSKGLPFEETKDSENNNDIKTKNTASSQNNTTYHLVYETSPVSSYKSSPSENLIPSAHAGVFQSDPFEEQNVSVDLDSILAKLQGGISSSDTKENNNVSFKDAVAPSYLGKSTDDSHTISESDLSVNVDISQLNGKETSHKNNTCSETTASPKDEPKDLFTQNNKYAESVDNVIMGNEGESSRANNESMAKDGHLSAFTDQVMDKAKVLFDTVCNSSIVEKVQNVGAALNAFVDSANEGENKLTSLSSDSTNHDTKLETDSKVEARVEDTSLVIEGNNIKFPTGVSDLPLDSPLKRAQNDDSVETIEKNTDSSASLNLTVTDAVNELENNTAEEVTIGKKSVFGDKCDVIKLAHEVGVQNMQDDTIKDTEHVDHSATVDFVLTPDAESATKDVETAKSTSEIVDPNVSGLQVEKYDHKTDSLHGTARENVTENWVLDKRSSANGDLLETNTVQKSATNEISNKKEQNIDVSVISDSKKPEIKNTINDDRAQDILLDKDTGHTSIPPHCPTIDNEPDQVENFDPSAQNDNVPVAKEDDDATVKASETTTEDHMEQDSELEDVAAPDTNVPEQSTEGDKDVPSAGSSVKIPKSPKSSKKKKRTGRAIKRMIIDDHSSGPHTKRLRPKNPKSKKK